MPLSNDLISQFVKLANDDQKKSNESTVYGTAKVITDDSGSVVSTRVILDGSTVETPVTTTTGVKDGDRVTVTIKDHAAVITGNTSAPSARGTGEEYRITADDISVTDAFVQNLRALFANFNELEVDELEAVNAKIESIRAKIADVDKLTASDINAIKAEIEHLKANVAEFDSLSTDDLKAVNAEIDKLDVYVGTFTYLSTNVFDAIRASIRELNAKKIAADQADIKYANIDFANIGEAAIRKLFADSGLIKDLVVGDQSITGELVGVTIKGDLIEGNTIKADKLVVKGSDGIYYKLNVEAGTFKDGEAVPTDSLHGSVITAKSVTAEKVNVKDLVAFGATIGSFVIDDEAIHSAGKGTVDATTPGVYQDRDGQFAVGDSDGYIRFYKDQNGKFHLIMKAEEFMLSSGKTVKEALDELHDKADGIKVVGRNLISYKSITARNTAYSLSATANSTAGTIVSDLYTYYFVVNSTLGLFKPGETYTVSVGDIKQAYGLSSPTDDTYINIRLWDVSANVGLTNSAKVRSGAPLTFTVPASADQANTVLYVYVSSSTAVPFEITNLKMEIGTTATEWSVAPEDIDEAISDVQTSVGETNEHVNDIEALLRILDGRIKTLVRSKDGGTLVEQNGDDFYFLFDITSVEEDLSKSIEDISKIEGLVLTEQGRVDVLNSSVASISKLTEYIRTYVNENDQPCLELGEGDSAFKVLITNTMIQFKDGMTTPAYIGNKKLNIETAQVKGELQVGDDDDNDQEGIYVWRVRQNGNMGLTWRPKELVTNETEVSV